MNWKKLIRLLLIPCLAFPMLAAAPPMAAGEGNPVCNGPAEPQNILILGTDSRSAGYLFGLADTIMVMRVDFVNQDVSLMGFPRDLWVEIPDVTEDNGRTHGKLNMAYHFGTEGMGYYSGEGYGAGLMAATMKQNWDLDIDHHVVINMRGFRDVVDALGGIEVYNPGPVYSFKQPNQPKFLPGGYFFSGTDALMYARYRDPRNVVDRIARHELILKALLKQLFSLSTIPKIPQLIGVFRGNMLTDMHLAEIAKFLCLASRVEPDQIEFHRIPKDSLYIPDWEGFVWLEKEPGSIQLLLEEFTEGRLRDQE